MIKEYVVTFLFTTNMDKVWMVEKQKPDWQKGCLNGIGGKIEKDELPIEAAIRELKEEAGIDKMNLWELGYMFGTNNDSSGFKVWIFTGVTDLELKTMEAEQILLKKINEKTKVYISFTRHSIIPISFVMEAGFWFRSFISVFS